MKSCRFMTTLWSASAKSPSSQLMTRRRCRSWTRRLTSWAAPTRRRWTSTGSPRSACSSAGWSSRVWGRWLPQRTSMLHQLSMESVRYPWLPLSSSHLSLLQYSDNEELIYDSFINPKYKVIFIFTLPANFWKFSIPSSDATGWNWVGVQDPECDCSHRWSWFHHQECLWTSLPFHRRHVQCHTVSLLSHIYCSVKSIVSFQNL